MSKNFKYVIIIIFVAIFAFVYFSKHTAAPGNKGVLSDTITASTPIGVRIKTSGCTANGALQDAACTPGAVFPSATKEQICVPGYSKTVRNVPASEKSEVYAEYGIANHVSGQYEVDHLVSLELGGSNDISNLWPEAADPVPGFHQKDGLEDSLHAQVCNGSISLQQAQQEIATNWLSIYQAGH